MSCVTKLSKFDVKRGEKEIGSHSGIAHWSLVDKMCLLFVGGQPTRKIKVLLTMLRTSRKLMEEQGPYHISHHSMATLNDRRHNQPDPLPGTSYLQKLKEYISFMIISLTSQFQATCRLTVCTW